MRQPSKDPETHPIVALEKRETMLGRLTGGRLTGFFGRRTTSRTADGFGRVQ